MTRSHNMTFDSIEDMRVDHIKATDKECKNLGIPSYSELVLALMACVDAMPHRPGCDYAIHMHPLTFIPYNHRKKWDAKRKALLETAPPCDCIKGHAHTLLSRFA